MSDSIMFLSYAISLLLNLLVFKMHTRKQMLVILFNLNEKIILLNCILSVTKFLALETK